MATDLVTREEVKVYLGFPDQDTHDRTLDAFIKSVSNAARQRCSRNFDQRAYTDILCGRGVRAVFAKDKPIAAAPAPQAFENGTALVIATDYSASADVGVNLEDGIFYRLPGSTSVAGRLIGPPGVWSKGVNNVKLVYTAGFAAADMPEDLKLAVKYAVGFFWKHPDRKEIGVSSRSDGTRTVSLLEELPAAYLGIIDRYRLPVVQDA